MTEQFDQLQDDRAEYWLETGDTVSLDEWIKLTTPDATAPGLCECGCGGKTNVSTKTDRARGWVKGQPIRFIYGHNDKRPPRPPGPLTEKRCPTCERVKPVSSFYPDQLAPNGLRSQCKACQTAGNAERRRTDPEFRERASAVSRASARKRPARQRQAEQDALRKVVGTPEWARRQVQVAVRAGKLIKPAACEHCGDVPPRHLLHGHHWHGDYAGRPLEVEWICSLCHGAEHSRRGHRRTADGNERVSAAASAAVPSSEDPIHGREDQRAGRDGRSSRPQSTEGTHAA